MAVMHLPEQRRGVRPAPTLRFGMRRLSVHDRLVLARVPGPARGLFRPRKRPLHVANVLALDVMVMVAIVSLAAVGIGPHVAEYRTLTMLTASMRPAYPPGSVIVVTEAPAESLREGDVITFHAPTEDRRVVTHRVMSVRDVAGTTRVITKGDANNANDPWGEFAIKGRTVWKARGAVPFVGHALATLRQPRVQLVMTKGLPLVLLVWLLASVWRKDDAHAPA